MQLYFGIVENRNDPLALGRCQVRVVSLHTHDKNLLPTADLPWCATMQPTISAAMNGIGHTPIGPVEGTSVVVTYLDDSLQQGLIMGAVGGIATEPVPIDFDDFGPILTSEDDKKKTVLRTVPGPTKGNKLKFYDPNSSRTDLTKDLKANMRVVGYGITDNTTIVSIDSGVQITISTEVKEFGENILEFLPPATNATAVVESKTLISAASVTDKADSVKVTPINNSIPTIPPKGSTSNQTRAAEGIKAILAACDKVGLTTKEQKCAIIGVAGGESGWLPVPEDYVYSPSNLKNTFKSATPDMIEKYSWANKKGLSRAEFFSWAYGPTFRGKGFFNHATDAEGGLYYGRGLIQLTGKSNYVAFQKEAKKYGLNIDIVNNPDLLLTDINVCAIVACLFVKVNVPSTVNPNSSPGYFNAVRDAVGKNNSAENKAKKLKYYEYFYGESPTTSHLKDAGTDIPTPPAEVTSLNNFQPGPSENAITSGSFSIGFRDPNNKYPLKEYIGESDVNRLARGVIKGTVVEDKDANRKEGIPLPFGGTWAQPMAPFAAQYPFNKVFETEGGHIQEFDDTPGNERINTYHRSGTFTEVDANGTQVNYIVGDNFILMENNGCIHVAGECNITVDGNLNLHARSDVNLKAAGSVTAEIGGNADIGVASDLTLKVGGDMMTQVGGQYKLTAAAGVEIVTDGEFGLQAGKAMSMKAGEMYLESAGIYALKASKDLAFQGGGTVGILAGKSLFTTASGGELHLKASGAVKLDGSTFAQQSNLAGKAGSVGGVSALVALSLAIPSAGSPLYSTKQYLTPPPRKFEENSVIETPDDWNTPEGRAVIDEKARKEGVDAPAVVLAEEVAKSQTIGKFTPVKTNCAAIYTTKDFTKDYRLSPHFTLGMMIRDSRHILQSQMLKPNRAAQERLYTVQEIVCNLATLCQNALEPSLELLPNGIQGYGKLWHITSGYRLMGVVKQETPSSDHCKGHCVDISYGNGVEFFSKNYDLVKKLDALLTYDQLILEYEAPNKSWIHISHKPEGNRREAFTMTNHTVSQSKGFALYPSIPYPVKK